jgi:peptide/nickel transport system permease protein
MSTPILTQPEASPADLSGRLTALKDLLRERPSVIVGLALLGFFIVVALLGPLIEPYSTAQQSGAVYGPPSLKHWFGLDDGGIDMFSETIQGARISLLVGGAATLVSLIIGGVIGIVAGYFGGILDIILMRITDFFLVIPSLVLMILVAALWGPSVVHVIFVIGLLLWTTTARVIRAQVKSLRERGFVSHARAFGATSGRIIVKHILPHVAPLLIANMILTVANAIFDETTLDFLGLGSASAVTWGTLLEHANDRTAVSYGAWWAFVPPGICIALVIVACYLIGQALEDSLNPRLKVAHISTRFWRIQQEAAEDRQASEHVSRRRARLLPQRK